MFAKSMLAVSAIAATLAAAAPMQQAEAKTNVEINLGFGGGGWTEGGYGFYGNNEGYYGHHRHHRPVNYQPVVSCGEGAQMVRYSGFRGVEPVDCQLPRYHYIAWKHNDQYLVTVSRFGDIIDLERY